MRTTVNLADDVASAVGRLRAERGMGLSEAVNQPVRRGLATNQPPAAAYVHRSEALGLRVDISNVADALDLLDD